MNKSLIHLSVVGVLFGSNIALGSGHGPVFGLSTPTNPKDGFSVDLSLMGRAGQGRNGVMLRGALGYGVTENLKLSISAPVTITTEPLAPARMSAFIAMTAGPTTLGVYKNYGVSAGIQFPIYQAVSAHYPKERFRWSVNVAYFF